MLQYAIGVLYDRGAFANHRGDITDRWKAIEWYGRAAVQGYAPAQFKFGLMWGDYSNTAYFCGAAGRGCPKDSPSQKEQEEKWLRRAADQGQYQSTGDSS